MCGVVAALGEGVTKTVWKSAEAMAHRGIRTHVTETRCGAVGHVRLPIVGLGTEHDQPMVRGPYTIGFVGEILDFKETNPEYECDAELVADKVTYYGPTWLQSRDGFWGIVIVDDEMQLLHVMTDYLGQKPMYYRVDTAAAASEPDALLPFGAVTLDRVYLSACVKWGYCPDLTRTPYNEIKHVLPGERVVLAKMGVVSRKIVDPLLTVPYDHPRDIKREIELAVKRRVLSSDVPVACLVSGGVDSAIVYTIAKRHGAVIPYHVSSGDMGVDDAEYWRMLRVVRSGPDWVPPHYNAAPALPRRVLYRDVDRMECLRTMQEPIDLGSLVPQVALSRAVEERACLTGDGADEMFGGYGRSMVYDSQGSDVFQELPAWHLPRLDRIMMRNRVEVRSPFLARRVAGMALSIPWAHRKNKSLLRDLFRDDLPQGIADAPKIALRTREVEDDRQSRSRDLAQMFVDDFDRRTGHG